jgi:phage terminase large subunit-like protein
MTPEPLFGTPRASERPTAGNAVISMAESLGKPLIGWQRHVVEVAFELDGDNKLTYRDVTVTTPRQSGKSTLLLPVIVARMLLEPESVVLYAAQNRLSARNKILDGWWTMIQRSPLAGEFREPTRATGNEALRAENGSLLRILSTEEASGHGEAVDLAILDECWALAEHVEQATRPATTTRPNSQIWCVSTAGNAKSVWWRGKVDQGRASVQESHGDTPTLSDRLAYFEWGAPIDADPADPAVWAAAMPAFGELVSAETVAADYAAMAEREFRRAFLNQWTTDLGVEGWDVIGRDVWASARWQQ